MAKKKRARPAWQRVHVPDLLGGIARQVAATLANGGRNPVTLEQIFEPEVVTAALSIMLSCGMYDASAGPRGAARSGEPTPEQDILVAPLRG